MPETPITVFLVDDHPIVEAGLRLGFGLTDEFRLIGTALTHDHALARLEELRPDVIVSDLVIGGELDLGYLHHYRRAVPEARIVAFSSLPSEAYSAKCLAAGADGFVSKSVSPHELARELKTILAAGRAARPAGAGDGEPAETTLVIDGIRLTPRETELAEGLAQGQSVRAIAKTLGISAKTAAIHRDNLRAKLNCASSSELIAVLSRRFGAAGR